MINWARKDPSGYEVSSIGDKRFSALYATLGVRTIEEWYQCDIKGYDPGGTDWRRGKGKPSLNNYPGDQLYELYLSLWRLWGIRNHRLLTELHDHARAHGNILKDCFASTPINQARALSQILNEWF